jgi:hypothetical protein
VVSLKQLLGSQLRAADGLTGRVSDFLIDEGTWTVGYASIPVGGILSGEHQFVPIRELSLDGQDCELTSSRELLELAAMSRTNLVTKAEQGWAAINHETPPHKLAGSPPAPQSPWRSFNAMIGCNITA